MEFETVATTLGLEWEILLVFVVLTVAALEITKDFGVKGKWLFVPAVVIAFFLNYAWFSRDGEVNGSLLIFGTIIVAILAIGGNAKLKNLVHKIGRPSTREANNEGSG